MAAVVAAGAVLAAAGTAWADFVTEAGSPYRVGADPYSVYAADFNGDGRPDVVTANGTSSDVSVFLRQPGGGFAQEAGSPVPAGGGPSGAAIGDFNHDGLLDLAVSDYTGGTVSVLLRQAGGGFALEGGQSIPTGTGANGIATADFNGDGQLDLAVTEQDANSVALLLRSAGNTGFTLGTTYPAGGQPRAIAAGDFNGDGLADLAVANFSGNSVTVLIQQAAGGFAAEGTPVPVGTQPGGIVATDLNGDGRTDLAVTDFGSSAVSILLRRATNDGFAEEAGSPVAVSANPVGITAADFDRDGHTDIAVATNAGAVDVLHNTGGGFTRLPAIQVGGTPNGIAAADFDGDGRPDLAVSEYTNSTFSALLNPAPQTPPPAPTPSPTPTPLPAPVAGKTVNVLPVSGKVKIKRPGSKTYLPLTAGAQFPVGTSVDARAGRVTIVAAQGKGKTASADFFDGLFTITQTKGSKPLTTLALTEKLGCPRAGHASAAAKKPKSRKLWGDGSGSFRTRGQYSAATVRGTRWLTQDTCGATLTRVAKGVVSVRDEVKHRTVIVRAGHRYTARRR